MTLEWIDAPRDYRAECENIAHLLKAHPGRWAKVLSRSIEVDVYVYELKRRGIETRVYNGREESDRNYNVWTRGDLYARAPKEAE